MWPLGGSMAARMRVRDAIQERGSPACYLGGEYGPTEGC